MQYYEQIVANRHSCRNFAKKPVGEDLLYKLLTYYDDRTRNLTEHIKTFIKFFDGSVCEKLGHYVGYNGHCIKAPAYMVVYSEEKGRYLENAGFIAEALTLKMTELGLSACWQTVNNAEAVKEVLGKETDMVVACVVAFGYRDKKNKEKPVEKISLDELTFGTKYGQDIDPTSFYRELEDGLRAMAHSQSFLNLQPYRVIVDTDQIVLVGTYDETTKEVDRHLNYGIAMFNFICVAQATRDVTPKWSFAPVTDRDLGLPADVKYVAKCKL